MNFNTIKEMESELSKITNLNELKHDITFKSQGVFYKVKFINVGSAAGKSDVYYMGEDTASNIRVEFTGSDRNIKVNKVIVNKLQ